MYRSERETHLDESNLEPMPAAVDHFFLNSTLHSVLELDFCHTDPQTGSPDGTQRFQIHGQVGYSSKVGGIFLNFLPEPS